jgi:hypothetical protein
VGGVLRIGNINNVNVTANLYGAFNFITSNGLNFSGIETLNTNAYTPLWFSVAALDNLGRPANGIGTPQYNMNLTYNNEAANKYFYKKNMDKYAKNKKNFEKINIKFEKKTNDKNKESINKKFGDDNSDSMFENDIQEISKNDFEDSKEDSGLLSFDKIEDLIVYNNMKDINKKDNYLFFKDDRKTFNYKYTKIIWKKFS